MKISFPKEKLPERRVSITPQTAAQYVKLGAEVVIEKDLASHLGWLDADYEKAGAKVEADSNKLLAEADMVLRLRKPSLEEIPKLKKDSIHVSFLDPFNEKDLLNAFAKQGVAAISMEMIPRTTKAQKMDALSSQASLAGYVAVIIAAQKLSKIFPMMMTPSGTIAPARVFIVGAGVAGLQAIATAKRLGARVDAFDTRPVVEEQVKSLGGKFVKIDLGETGQTTGGYAKELTAEQLAKQREGMKKICAQSDVVITTAQIFGKKAPVIITKDMVAAMRPESVLIDLAVETGGNIEGSVAGEDVIINGVRIVGMTNLPGLVAQDASRMYGNNLQALITEFWNKETKSFQLKLEDEILKAAVVVANGVIRLGQ